MRSHDPIAADLQELIALRRAYNRIPPMYRRSTPSETFETLVADNELLAARLVKASRRGLRAKLRRLVRAVRTTDLNAGDIALLMLAVLLGFRVRR